MWGTSDPDINWVEGVLLYENGSTYDELGPLDFTY